MSGPMPPGQNKMSNPGIDPLPMGQRGPPEQQTMRGPIPPWMRNPEIDPIIPPPQAPPPRAMPRAQGQAPGPQREARPSRAVPPPPPPQQPAGPSVPGMPTNRGPVQPPPPQPLPQLPGFPGTPANPGMPRLPGFPTNTAPPPPAPAPLTLPGFPPPGPGADAGSVTPQQLAQVIAANSRGNDEISSRARGGGGGYTPSEIVPGGLQPLAKGTPPASQNPINKKAANKGYPETDDTAKGNSDQYYWKLGVGVGDNTGAGQRIKELHKLVRESPGEMTVLLDKLLNDVSEQRNTMNMTPKAVKSRMKGYGAAEKEVTKAGALSERPPGVQPQSKTYYGGAPLDQSSVAPNDPDNTIVGPSVEPRRKVFSPKDIKAKAFRSDKEAKQDEAVAQQEKATAARANKGKPPPTAKDDDDE